MYETWKKIEDFGGNYLISDKGRVLSKHGYNGRAPKILTPTLNKQRAYYYIALQDGSKQNRKNFILHRLVAKYFVPNIDNKPIVNHIDCDKTNNAATNLEWCTNKENAIHAIKMGRQIIVRGEECVQAKLTEANIRYILSKKGKIYYKDLAKTFNVGYSTIAHVMRGSRWSHVKRS